MNNFWNGFEKRAKMSPHAKEMAAILGMAGAMAGGAGALSGHVSHVGKKIDYARAGKDFKEKSFIDRHPKTTGALSLGLAPAVSRILHKRKMDMENPKVRGVLEKHPMVSGPGMF